VIQLLGTRDRTPPSFESVQDRLKQIVVSKRFKATSDEMLKTAKIEPPLAGVAAAAPTPAPAPAAPAAN
jgi:hypothetical protein